MEDILDIIVKREYLNSKNKSDIVNVPNNLRKNLLSINKNDDYLKLLEAPIISMRIIFKILNDISYDQFRYKDGIVKNDKNLKQFSLFEEEFKTVNNTFARFEFNITEIDKNRDYEAVKKALEFLEEYKKDWHTSINSKGKKIKSYGGFLSNATLSDSKIAFTISSYWLENLVNMNTGYNESLMQLPWKTKNIKHFLFYLLLLNIVEFCVFNYEEMNKSYGLNYKSASNLAIGFLKPAKILFDAISSKSFNYTVKGNNITIIIYHQNIKNKELKPKTITKLQIREKLHYFKKRHKLSDDNLNKIKNVINLEITAFNIFSNAYKLMVKDYSIKKKVMTDVLDNDFMLSFQAYIKIQYSEHSPFAKALPNGYPNII